MISSWKYKDIIFAYISESQISQLVDILHDPEVEKYLWFAPITEDGFRAFTLPLIEQQKNAFSKGEYPASATFTVTKDAELLGICGINQMPDGHNVAVVGYQLTRSAWGQGIATCCLEFLLHYSKTYLKLRKLFGDCVAANKASARVLEKCGFAFEGTIKEKYDLGGRLHDNDWYGRRMEDVSQLPDSLVEEISEA